MKSSKKRDGISKWYIIFAAFLAVNFCCLSYAYYVKFYKNKKTIDTTGQSDSSLSEIIVQLTDTIYVDHEEMDSIQEVADEANSKPVADASVINAAINKAKETVKETAIAPKTTTENKTTTANKTTTTVKPEDYVETEKPVVSPAKNPVTAKGNAKPEEENHSFLVSLGMFKSKSNALNLMADLNKKGIDAEIVESDHFSKMAPGYILVLAGKELSSATAYQIGADMKKKGLENFVKDAGKYSWR